MDLQESIDQTSIGMTEGQVRAFFVGVQCADHPMNFTKAVDELLAEHLDAMKDLEFVFKQLWKDIEGNLRGEAENLFPDFRTAKETITTAHANLDYFLTAMSLAGTNSESAQNAHMMELIDSMESILEELEEFMDDPEDLKVGEDLKHELDQMWTEFMNTKFVR